jgi:hypothetical protein
MDLEKKQQSAAGLSVMVVGNLHSEPSQRWRPVQLENSGVLVGSLFGFLKGSDLMELQRK